MRAAAALEAGERSLISASLGFFFFARSAAAVMIQPLMQ